MVFKAEFLQRRFQLTLEHEQRSNQIFRVSNPLLYQEFSHRGIRSSGDYVSYRVDSGKKFQVEVENYYTTYLPDKAASKEVLGTLHYQSSNQEGSIVKFEEDIEQMFNRGCHYKTGTALLKNTER